MHTRKDDTCVGMMFAGARDSARASDYKSSKTVCGRANVTKWSGLESKAFLTHEKEMQRKKKKKVFKLQPESYHLNMNYPQINQLYYYLKKINK